MSARTPDTAALMLGLGVVLWLPPIALIFIRPQMVFGVPLPMLYFFGTWLALVLGAAVVAHRLPDAESGD